MPLLGSVRKSPRACGWRSTFWRIRIGVLATRLPTDLVLEKRVDARVFLALMVLPGDMTLQAQLVHCLLQLDTEPGVMHPEVWARLLIDRNVAGSVRHEHRTIIFGEVSDRRGVGHQLLDAVRIPVR